MKERIDHLIMMHYSDHLLNVLVKHHLCAFYLICKRQILSKPPSNTQMTYTESIARWG